MKLEGDQQRLTIYIGESDMVVGVGALGAYTTFSTLTYECVRLVEEGALAGAILNAAASVAVGLAAASAGLALTAL